MIGYTDNSEIVVNSSSVADALEALYKLPGPPGSEKYTAATIKTFEGFLEWPVAPENLIEGIRKFKVRMGIE